MPLQLAAFSTIFYYYSEVKGQISCPLNGFIWHHQKRKVSKFSSTMTLRRKKVMLGKKFRKNNLLYSNIKFMKFSFIKFLFNHHISEGRLMCLKIIPIMTFLWHFPNPFTFFKKSQVGDHFWKNHRSSVILKNLENFSHLPKI